MNSYNIYDDEYYATILYHAIAESEEQVRELAKEKGYDIEGLTIELEFLNVRDELGKPIKAQINNAQIH